MGALYINVNYTTIHVVKKIYLSYDSGISLLYIPKRNENIGKHKLLYEHVQISLHNLVCKGTQVTSDLKTFAFVVYCAQNALQHSHGLRPYIISSVQRLVPHNGLC